MFRTLYGLAGPAIIAWLLLILLPRWRVTRWLAESAVFPVYLSCLYLIGIVVILRASGPGIMQDFGNIEGVLSLLAREEGALIAWIHILAFDQFVGLFIYRDNMRHVYVPLPIQSVLLFLTLMFGPVGFLGYFLIRATRRPGQGGLLARIDPFASLRTDTGTRAPPPLSFGAADDTAGLDNRIAALPSPVSEPLRYITTVWLRTEPAISAAGALGLVLAAAVGAFALSNGPVVEPEGVLSKAITFDFAFGVYLLSIVPLVPLARFPLRKLRVWRPLVAGFGIIGLLIETVQTVRGLDPRFSAVAGPIDNAISFVFLSFAVATMALFWHLAVRLFDVKRTGAEADLILALRYACLATGLAFVAGIAMSVMRTRFFGSSGNFLTLHALGFHALQAIPLVAIVMTRASVPSERVRRTIHVAGIAWLACCLFVGAQTLAGLSIVVPTFASVGAVLLFLVWMGVALRAFARLRGTSPRPA